MSRRLVRFFPAPKTPAYIQRPDEVEPSTSRSWVPFTRSPVLSPFAGRSLQARPLISWSTSASYQPFSITSRMSAPRNAMSAPGRMQAKISAIAEVRL